MTHEIEYPLLVKHVSAWNVSDPGRQGPEVSMGTTDCWRCSGQRPIAEYLNPLRCRSHRSMMKENIPWHFLYSWGERLLPRGAGDIAAAAPGETVEAAVSVSGTFVLSNCSCCDYAVPALARSRYPMGVLPMSSCRGAEACVSFEWCPGESG